MQFHYKAAAAKSKAMEENNLMPVWCTGSTRASKPLGVGSIPTAGA
jgi:hypothetical protein